MDQFVSLLSGKKVLDVGCASGRESKYLFDKYLSVTGCDIAEEFIKLSNINCPGGKFFVSDMRKLDSSKETFDGMWVSASFLHIPKIDAEHTLKGFNKLLNENGILYLSVMGRFF